MATIASKSPMNKTKNNELDFQKWKWWISSPAFKHTTTLKIRSPFFSDQNITDRFAIDITSTEGSCVSCFTTIKKIDQKIELNSTFPDDGGEIDAQAAR